jgi:hypothetical protein
MEMVTSLILPQVVGMVQEVETISKHHTYMQGLSCIYVAEFRGGGGLQVLAWMFGREGNCKFESIY